MTSGATALAEKEKRNAALSSVLAAVLLTGLKLVVGRDEQDNARLEELMGEEEVKFFVPDYGSPMALIIGGEPSEDDIRFAAATCARYSDAKKLSEVRVRMQRGGDQSDLTDSCVRRRRTFESMRNIYLEESLVTK